MYQGNLNDGERRDIIIIVTTGMTSFKYPTTTLFRRVTILSSKCRDQTWMIYVHVCLCVYEVIPPQPALAYFYQTTRIRKGNHPGIG